MSRVLAAAALLLTQVSLVLAPAHHARAHDVERAEALLSDVATYRRAASDGPSNGDRDEALFRLGVTVETLVEALNRDVAAHGTRDLFAELVVQRLRAHALNVVWVPDGSRYAYDLRAFGDYLRRAPRGRWAPEAKFRFISRRFYATLGTDLPRLVGTSVADLLAAVVEDERFLREHGSHERAGSVRFFLAVDHYRIARNVTDPLKRREHVRRARQALQQTVEHSAEAFEVRAAQTLLETLAADGTGGAR